jgi:hypothetical protein
MFRRWSASDTTELYHAIFGDLAMPVDRVFDRYRNK